MIDMMANKIGPHLVTVLEQEEGNGKYPPPNIKVTITKASLWRLRRHIYNVTVVFLSLSVSVF